MEDKNPNASTSEILEFISNQKNFLKTLNIQINMLNIDIVTNGSTLLNHIIRRMVAYH